MGLLETFKSVGSGYFTRPAGPHAEPRLGKLPLNVGPQSEGLVLAPKAVPAAVGPKEALAAPTSSKGSTSQRAVEQGPSPWGKQLLARFVDPFMPFLEREQAFVDLSSSGAVGARDLKSALLTQKPEHSVLMQILSQAPKIHDVEKMQEVGAYIGHLLPVLLRCAEGAKTEKDHALVKNAYKVAFKALIKIDRELSTPSKVALRAALGAEACLVMLFEATIARALDDPRSKILKKIAAEFSTPEDVCATLHQEIFADLLSEKTGLISIDRPANEEIMAAYPQIEYSAVLCQSEMILMAHGRMSGLTQESMRPQFLRERSTNFITQLSNLCDDILDGKENEPAFTNNQKKNLQSFSRTLLKLEHFQPTGVNGLDLEKARLDWLLEL